MPTYVLRPHNFGLSLRRELYPFLPHLRYRRADTGLTTTPTHPSNLVINWGSSNAPNTPNVLNRGAAVHIATNKLSTLRTLTQHQVPRVAWTTDEGMARGWQRDGHKVVARTRLTGTNGDGIVIMSANSPLSTLAPLYTKYYPTRKEYRVHIAPTFSDVDPVFQRKVRRDEADEANNEVRNVANGWAYHTASDEWWRAHGNLRANLKIVASNAVNPLGLHFGAVDILKAGNEFLVLEGHEPL